jgi:hypothetical protein
MASIYPQLTASKSVMSLSGPVKTPGVFDSKLDRAAGFWMFLDFAEPNQVKSPIG